MLGSLPEFVDPMRLARQRARMQGAVPIAGFSRAAGVLGDDSGVAQVELRFRVSASGVPRLDGSVRLNARVQCQRCLGSFELELLADLKISFTDGGEALGRAELAAGYEPLEYEGPIGLTTFVEDEILLALPDFPMHPPEECPSVGAIGREGPVESPFAGLRAQLDQFRT